MTGEELNRKYWQMKGASINHENGWFWLSPPFTGDGFRSESEAWATLPPLHLDANLAIAEAKKKHPLWTVVVLDGEFVFKVGKQSGKGTTLGEAFLDFEIKDLKGDIDESSRQKALIAAGGK